MFDDHVKYALGLSRSPEITYERSTLCKFRARALENDLDRKLLGQTLLYAAESGMLSHDEDLVDFFMVAGAAAKKGTFILIHEAIRLLLLLGSTRDRLIQRGCCTSLQSCEPTGMGKDGCGVRTVLRH